jgi:heme exporter protein B
MWRDALLVAGRDLRIERRARVGLNQVVPFALSVLVLFAFALEVEDGTLARLAAGLFWVTVLLATVLTVQRSAAVEAAPGVRDALRLSALDPGGVFLGKAAALAVELAVLEVLLGAGVVVLYDVDPAGLPTLAAAAVIATVGLAAAGTAYGALAGGLRVRDTLLPLLLLPVVAPVLLAATRASEEALGQVDIGLEGGATPWLGLLLVFAAVYTAVGTLAYGPLLEDG